MALRERDRGRFSRRARAVDELRVAPRSVGRVAHVEHSARERFHRPSARNLTGLILPPHSITRVSGRSSADNVAARDGVLLARNVGPRCAAAGSARSSASHVTSKGAAVRRARPDLPRQRPWRWQSLLVSHTIGRHVVRRTGHQSRRRRGSSRGVSYCARPKVKGPVSTASSSSFSPVSWLTSQPKSPHHRVGGPLDRRRDRPAP